MKLRCPKCEIAQDEKIVEQNKFKCPLCQYKGGATWWAIDNNVLLAGNVKWIGNLSIVGN
jgi:hypothetical protein